MGLFSKIFGSKKTDLDSVVEDTLTGILDKGGFDLSYNLDVTKKEEITEIKIDFSGPDEALLKDFKGQLMDAIQLIVTVILIPRDLIENNPAKTIRTIMM